MNDVSIFLLLFFRVRPAGDTINGAIGWGYNVRDMGATDAGGSDISKTVVGLGFIVCDNGNIDDSFAKVNIGANGGGEWRT